MHVERVPSALLIVVASITACLAEPPSLCRLRPEPGTRCLEQSTLPACVQPRYYWHRRRGRCAVFWFGGCRRNGNNFRTEAACEQKCGPAACPPISSVAPLPTRTDLERGCGFERRDNAQSGCAEWALACPPPPPDGDACRLPHSVAGPCEALVPSWAYHSAAGQCVGFDYGGCRGNQNRFATRAECERLCKPSSRQMECDAANACPPPLTCLHGRCANVGGGSCDRTMCQRCHQCVADDSGRAKCVWQPGTCDFGCRDGGRPAQCFANPCRVTHCPRHADAVCAASHCGGCLALFYDRQWNAISDAQCGREASPRCPPPPTAAPPAGCEYDALIGRAGCPVYVPRCPPADATAAGRICRRPKVVGPCEAATPRYYFEPHDAACAPFAYGGCGGNGNNFVTLGECKDACAGVQPCAAAPTVVPPPSGCEWRQVFSDAGECPRFDLHCGDGEDGQPRGP